MSKRRHVDTLSSASEDDDLDLLHEDFVTSNTPHTTVSPAPIDSGVHTKINRLDDTHLDRPAMPLISCNLPGCPSRDFSTYEEYESHYSKLHTNRCLDCSKNFPSERVLECHIKENHDMLSQLKKEKGEKIYECFVEDCDKVCSSHHKRRLHLIDKHYYPKDFNFYIVNDGIDRAKSLLRSPPRKSKARIRSPSDATMTLPTSPSKLNGNKSLSQSNDMDIDDTKIERHVAPMSKPSQHKRTLSEPELAKKEKEGRSNGAEPEDDVMSDLTSKMSAIKMVPPSVRFGRRGAGFGKK